MTPFMKKLLLPIVLSVSVYAQSIEISNPGNGTSQALGQPVNIEVDFPVSDLGIPAHRS